MSGGREGWKCSGRQRGVGKHPLDMREKGFGKGGFVRGSEGEGYHGKELGTSGRREFVVERLLGEVAGERVLPALQGGFVLGWGYSCLANCARGHPVRPDRKRWRADETSTLGSTQNWSLHYERLERPADEANRMQQGAGQYFSWCHHYISIRLFIVCPFLFKTSRNFTLYIFFPNSFYHFCYFYVTLHIFTAFYSICLIYSILFTFFILSPNWGVAYSILVWCAILLWWGLDVSVVHAKKTTIVQYRLNWVL